MRFGHSPAVRQAFPELVAGVLRVDGIDDRAAVDAPIATALDAAKARLGDGSESDLPQIQAWRRAFSRMGLKPTQYRCASEALLRRLRKEGDMPRLHPLVDVCNALSMAYAIPVAALDLRHVAGDLEVRHASGNEDYLAFSGEHEHPEPGEVVFVDAENRAHARRWTNRQSALSAIRADSSSVLIVAEAMHEDAARDIAALVDALAAAIGACWRLDLRRALLTRESPAFDG